MDWTFGLWRWLFGAPGGRGDSSVRAHPRSNMYNGHRVSASIRNRRAYAQGKLGAAVYADVVPAGPASRAVPAGADPSVFGAAVVQSTGNALHTGRFKARADALRATGGQLYRPPQGGHAAGAYSKTELRRRVQRAERNALTGMHQLETRLTGRSRAFDRAPDGTAGMVAPMHRLHRVLAR